MFSKHRSVLAVSAGFMALLATPALANHVDTATIRVSCTGYTITVTASELTVGSHYTISYQINGFPSPITGSIPFTAQSSSYNSGPISGSVGPFTGTFNVSGSATLTGENTVTASVSPTTLTCSGGPPPNCTAPGSINSGFNGTAVTGTNSGPATIWFNSHINLKNIPAGKSVTITNSHVTINGMPYSVPDGHIVFANVSCATTSYDAGSNSWTTTVPTAGSDEIFLTGLAFPVTNLPGGANVTWDGQFSTDQPGICLSWQWGAAAYKTWTDYNSASIKPTHSGACSGNGGDHAGAPQNPTIRSSVTGGARGGGGSNFTGSWSSTGNVCPPCASSGSGGGTN